VREHEPHEGTQFKIKQFLEEREVGGRTEYFVEWLNFPRRDGTWEPAFHLRAELGDAQFEELAREQRSKRSEQIYQDWERLWDDHKKQLAGSGWLAA
jgi:hypothetical protein